MKDIIQNGLQTWLASRGTALGDRSETIGASEIGHCGRMVIERKKIAQTFDNPITLVRGYVAEGIVEDFLKQAGFKPQCQMEIEIPPFKIHPDLVFEGANEIAVCEIKSPGRLPSEPHRYWRDQVTLQMGAIWMQKQKPVKGGVICLSFIDGPEFWPLTFDEQRYSRLLDKGLYLHQCIKQKETPKAEPGESCWFCPVEIKKNCFFANEDTTRELPLLDKLAELRGQIKPLKAKEEELANQLKEFLKDIPGNAVKTANHTACLETRVTTRVDSKTLKHDLPDVFSKYAKVSKSEMLRIAANPSSG